MSKKILMTINSCGETIASCRQSIGAYGDKSGVIILLELDPESVVEVHKPDGTSIRYEYVKE